MPAPVRVNVGGQVFWTTSTTLTSTTGHYLYNMFKHAAEGGMQGTRLLDADGVPFIDRCAGGPGKAHSEQAHYCCQCTRCRWASAAPQRTSRLSVDPLPPTCRDPRWFPLILNFLRDGYVPLPPTLHERQQLRQEALFYGLQARPYVQLQTGDAAFWMRLQHQSGSCW